MIDVIECFQERALVATEATEANKVSLPSASSADSIAQMFLDDDQVDRAKVTDEKAKISWEKDKVQFILEI